ncbi:MAG TPA: T9SS type A sorting domain-containing protein [Bacteroidota bacterium]|nr:T9SS type A sorting domain-containing protein [Bacteroidota bacterium]
MMFKRLGFVSITVAMWFLNGGFMPVDSPSMKKTQAVSYNIYFGNLHAHTAYSDGNKDSTTSGVADVYGSFQYAKNTHELDFLGISEHNHSQAGLLIADWYKGVAQRDSFNTFGVDTNFVALFGQEWGVISGGGHVLIYGTDKLFGWETIGGSPNYQVYVPKSDYTALFNAVRAEGGFATLAHPQSTDFGGFFSSYNAAAHDVVVGTALVSGPAFSTNIVQSDPSTSTFQARYHDALARGYRVGATIDQDTHNTNFGMANQERTAVIATERTESAIIEAVRARRFYGTMNKNLRISMSVNGAFMGEEIASSGPVNFAISVSDPDVGSTTTKIEIRCGIPGSGIAPTTLTSVTNSSTLNYSWNQPIGTTYYYYAYVQQTEGSSTFNAWTSPVWNERSSELPVQISFFNATSRDLNVELRWSTATEENNYGFEIERRSISNVQQGMSSWEKVGFIAGAGTSSSPKEYRYLDANLPAGRYVYRIKQIDNDGTFRYSENTEVEVGLAAKEFKLESNYPNPFNPSTTIQFTLAADGNATLKVYNMLGQEVETLFDGEAQAGRIQQVKFDASRLPSGLYFAKLEVGKQQMMRKMVLMK